MLERVIKPSQTRVLSFINIVGHGMIGSRYEVTYRRPEGATGAPRNFEVRSRKGGTVAAPRWAAE